MKSILLLALTLAQLLRAKKFFQMWKTRMTLVGAALTEIVADQVKFVAHQAE